MRMRTNLSVAAATLLMTASLGAQISPMSVGLFWSTTGGASAGVLGCGPNPFTCVIDSISVAAGDQFTLQVRGQFGGAYALALAGGSIPCTPVPGVLNQLLLNPALLVLTVPGVMNQPDPILACPGGVGSTSLIWPAGISGGQTLFLQAVATGPGGQLAFTNAIQITTL